VTAVASFCVLHSATWND